MSTQPRILKGAAPVAARRIEAAVFDADRRVREMVAAAEERARAVVAAAWVERDSVVAEAREAGRREGEARAAATLVRAAAERDQMLREAGGEVARLAIAVARKVLGRELAEAGGALALAEAALVEARSCREVVLRVNPADAPAVRAAGRAHHAGARAGAGRRPRGPRRPSRRSRGRDRGGPHRRGDRGAARGPRPRPRGGAPVLTAAADLLAAVERATPLARRGRLTRVTGLTVEAALGGVVIGELVEIRTPGRTPLPAEVVGVREDRAVLMPLGDVAGVGLDGEVIGTGRPLSIRVGEGLRGRILDGLGRPVDGAPLPAGLEEWPVSRPPPPPLARGRIAAPLSLGVRALDGLATLGEGQRIGIFAGAGAGKSTLLGQIARNARAELSVVCLVGERGREVREFVEDALGPEGLARSVVVAATSDEPALVRREAAHVATAIAEWFAGRGARVLLVVDSLTRYARAQREVGLAAGEAPARLGYPPSVFAALPRLVERAGNRARGGITAVYTVLVAGNDLDEPIADEVRGLLDGHVVLERRLAERGALPGHGRPREPLADDGGGDVGGAPRRRGAAPATPRRPRVGPRARRGGGLPARRRPRGRPRARSAPGDRGLPTPAAIRGRALRGHARMARRAHAAARKARGMSAGRPRGRIA